MQAGGAANPLNSGPLGRGGGAEVGGERVPRVLGEVRSSPMSDDEFWKLIALIDREQLAGGDEDVAIEPLASALASRPEDDLRGFEDVLAQKLYALDGQRFAQEAGNSGGSDDAFLYARCWVVGAGKEHYHRVLATPRLMPKSLDEWLEPLLYVASNAYEKATGEEWDHETPVSWETGSNEAEW